MHHKPFHMLGGYDSHLAALSDTVTVSFIRPDLDLRPPGAGPPGPIMLAPAVISPADRRARLSRASAGSTPAAASIITGDRPCRSDAAAASFRSCVRVAMLAGTAACSSAYAAARAVALVRRAGERSRLRMDTKPCAAYRLSPRLCSLVWPASGIKSDRRATCPAAPSCISSVRAVEPSKAAARAGSRSVCDGDAGAGCLRGRRAGCAGPAAAPPCRVSELAEGVRRGRPSRDAVGCLEECTAMLSSAAKRLPVPEVLGDPAWN